MITGFYPFLDERWGSGHRGLGRMRTDLLKSVPMCVNEKRAAGVGRRPRASRMSVELRKTVRWPVADVNATRQLISR
jgi:hypothetical protein